MNFQIYAPVFFLALASTALTLPLWRQWSLKTGLVDDPGQRKIHQKTVPLAGGLAVFSGILFPLIAAVLALWWNIVPEETAALMSYGLERRAGQLAAILAAAVGITVVGYWDDHFELRAGVKFAGQFLVALLLAGSGLRLTLFVESPWFSYAITILWILTVINAFNFIDNMNGLCAGIGFIASWGMALHAAGQGQYLVALLGFLVAGSLLGFLPYNFPRAKVFLGDSGSHLVGLLLAVLAILPDFYSPRTPYPWAVAAPLLFLGVPLADLVWVVVLRWRAGRPFYVGDTNHVSHRLVRRGWTQSSAVLLLWLWSALLGAAGIFLARSLGELLVNRP